MAGERVMVTLDLVLTAAPLLLLLLLVGEAGLLQRSVVQRHALIPSSSTCVTITIIITITIITIIIIIIILSRDLLWHAVLPGHHGVVQAAQQDARGEAFPDLGCNVFVITLSAQALCCTARSAEVEPPWTWLKVR